MAQQEAPSYNHDREDAVKRKSKQTPISTDRI